MYSITKTIALLLVAVLALASCTAAKGDPEWAKLSKKAPSIDKDDIIADALFEAVNKAVKGKDTKALKDLFSKKALAEAEDIDDGIEYLFGLIKGDVVSWEQESIATGDSFRLSKYRMRMASWYILTTTEDTYIFFMLDYDPDEIEPDNDGMYALRVFREADAATQEGNWVEMRIPGVYKPEA
jgi:hypothetical protein